MSAERNGDATTAESRLYIFPHAGGTAQFYVPFAKAFTASTRCVAVQYPGRRTGKDMSWFTTIPALVDKICTTLNPQDDSAGQIAFFGHSMGALVAFETALRFQACGAPIAALFVSACAAPGRMRYAGRGASDADLLGLVAEVTGVNPEFLNDEQFAATLLPTLRGLKAVASYDCAPDTKVSCPIYASMADDDELCTAEMLTPWGERTTSDFQTAVFPGDHFYMNTNLPQLPQWIQERILARCAGPAQPR